VILFNNEKTNSVDIENFIYFILFDKFYLDSFHVFKNCQSESHKNTQFWGSRASLYSVDRGCNDENLKIPINCDTADNLA